MNSNGKCGGRVDHFETKAEAIEAWNTRAERTCHEVDDTPPPGFESLVTYSTICSECGAQLALDEYDAPNYCPNCGAKVVSDR